VVGAVNGITGPGTGNAVVGAVNGITGPGTGNAVDSAVNTVTGPGARQPRYRPRIATMRRDVTDAAVRTR
jgi:hypothetical protein